MLKSSAGSFLGLLWGWIALWTIPAGAATTPLVNHGDLWRYHKGTNAPQASWMTAADAALDATWPSGNGGFGFSTSGAGETVDAQTLLGDMQNRYTTLYVRRQFT